MGYSATAAAFRTLDAIGRYTAYEGGPSNGFRNGGTEGFWEIGREQKDGAITGMVYLTRDGYIVKSASFRINPDGVVARFPFVVFYFDKWITFKGWKGVTDRYDPQVEFVREFGGVKDSYSFR